ncbi:MAG: hypothetical protein ACLQDY_29460 [Streptosporangiaceae bacterium]
MDWYSVRAQALAPADAPRPAADEGAADALMELLEGHDGVVSSGEASWDATVSVQAASAREAADRGAGLIEELAGKVGMPMWPVVRAEAVRQDVLDAEIERPTLPELVSAPEAAEILGVSPQRVHELAAGHAGFPRPVYELRAGRLWLRRAIEVFGERWERKPGRPRKAAAG